MQQDNAETTDAPVFQYSLCPRWLEYSGLPQVLGPTRWAVFRALVALDHQTLALERRRHGHGGKIFAAPQVDVAAMGGLCLRTTRRALKGLAGTELLAHYKPGSARAWSHFRINTDLLVELFRYVAPRLRRIHGGVHGLTHNELPSGGIQVYGRKDIGAVCIRWETLHALQKANELDQPEPPDPARVREICHL